MLWVVSAARSSWHLGLVKQRDALIVIDLPRGEDHQRRDRGEQQQVQQENAAGELFGF